MTRTMADVKKHRQKELYNAVADVLANVTTQLTALGEDDVEIAYISSMLIHLASYQGTTLILFLFEHNDEMEEALEKTALSGIREAIQLRQVVKEKNDA